MLFSCPTSSSVRQKPPLPSLRSSLPAIRQNPVQQNLLAWNRRTGLCPTARPCHSLRWALWKSMIPSWTALSLWQAPPRLALAIRSLMILTTAATTAAASPQGREQTTRLCRGLVRCDSRSSAPLTRMRIVHVFPVHALVPQQNENLACVRHAKLQTAACLQATPASSAVLWPEARRLLSLAVKTFSFPSP